MLPACNLLGQVICPWMQVPRKKEQQLSHWIRYISVHLGVGIDMCELQVMPEK